MYVVDSDVLIAAKNTYYAFDIVPAFWDWLTRAHAAGKVFVVEKVAEEILAGADELATWMRQRPASFRLTPVAADAPSMAKVARWANGAGYAQGAVATFLGAGDFFLVSQALTLNYAVITNEKPEPGSKKRIKIPDACNAVGVRWMNSFQLLKQENVRFVL
jgi:hypothetical protein